jgi:hypothetical protein
VNRAARSDWGETYWTYWASIRQVWLGGGLIQGQLGQRAVSVAQQLIRDAGINSLELSRASFPASLPLLGVARYAPAAAQAVVVVDCGSTSIKCARAILVDGVITELRDLTATPSLCRDWIQEPGQATAFGDRLLAVLEDAYQRRLPCDPLLLIIMANYVQDGRVAERGCYGLLRPLADRVDLYFAQQLSQRVGHPGQVAMFHDGTAAAAVFAGTVHSAVLMLGTAVGLGFPPLTNDLRPYSVAIQ